MSSKQFTYEFAGPAYLTLVSAGCLTGKGNIEIKDASDNWSTLYYEGSVVSVSRSNRTAAIKAPGDYRVNYTCRDCSDIGDTSEWMDTPADFGGGGSATHTLSAGVDSDVPAGLHSVTIVNLTGTTTLDIDETPFILGDDSTITAIMLTGQEHGSNGVLPAISISGTSWQWLGQDKL